MPHTKRTFDGLDAKTEWFRDTLKPQSLLYIGWRHDCHKWWYSTFCPNLGINRIGILEIFKPNYEHARAMASKGLFGFGKDLEIVMGDARSASWNFNPKSYDIVFWDHGPEHVTFDDLKIATAELSQIANKMLLYCCPWGSWPQGETDGNNSEVHLFDVEPEHMHQLGMTVETFGAGPGQNLEGEMFAYKIFS